MPNTVDLRTYVLLERAFVRRLQRSWRQQSAPTYAKITQACLDHQWDTARRYVTDLDMTEVGTQNREWITYMLLSCAVFGANTVAKGKPSFVGVGSFDTFLKQTTNNMLQYLEHRGTAQVQAEALQSIAEDEAKTKALPKVAFDESKHPRDKDGQFTDVPVGLPEGVEDTLEGRGGPARVKWWHLNKAVIDANEAMFDARDVQSTVRKRLEKKYTVHGQMMWGQLETPDQEEFTQANMAVRRAELAVQDAEAALEAHAPVMRKEVVSNLATSMAEKLGVDPSIIHVVDKEAPEFVVGDKHFREGGHFDPSDGQIEINARNLPYGDAPAVKGLAAHELSHAMYHALEQAADAEFDRFREKAGYDGEHTPWFYERFTQKGMYGQSVVKPERRADVEREFPALTVAAIMSGYIPGRGVSEAMKEEDGHSAYAKSYWAPEAVRARGSYTPAANETVAEVTRYLTNPQSWHETVTPDPDSPWTQFTQAMHEWYKWNYEQVRKSRGYHPPDAKGRKYGEPGYNT